MDFDKLINAAYFYINDIINEYDDSLSIEVLLNKIEIDLVNKNYNVSYKYTNSSFDRIIFVDGYLNPSNICFMLSELRVAGDTFVTTGELSKFYQLSDEGACAYKKYTSYIIDDDYSLPSESPTYCMDDVIDFEFMHGENDLIANFEGLKKKRSKVKKI